jgi:single-strand DNA-binding protein
MPNLNKVQLIGNIGDLDVRYSVNGDPIVNFSLATTDKWKDKKTGQPQEKTEWHRCVAFGKTAEFLSNHMGVGCNLFVEEGKLQTRKWEDKDGNNRYTTEVVANRVQPITWPKNEADPTKGGKGGETENSPSKSPI